jgi:hypothetical protein
VGSRQGEQSAWQDRQPLCTAVHQPARLRYGGVSFEEEDTTGAAERCQWVQAMAAKQRDGLSKSIAAAFRCRWHENDEQCTMDSRACSRAAVTFVRGGTLPLCRTKSVRSDVWAIKEYVAWTTMAKDVKVFVQNYLRCVATVPGDKVPRPLGTQLHATNPNEILHSDFLYIGLSRDGKYQHLKHSQG